MIDAERDRPRDQTLHVHTTERDPSNADGRAFA